MNEKDIKALVTVLAPISTFAVLGIIGHIAESYRLKKAGVSLHMRNEALRINRETVRWMRTDGLKLDPAEFHRQFNERLDYTIFIANH